MVAFSVSWLPHGAAATTIAERSAPRVAQFSATARRERLGRTTVGTCGCSPRCYVPTRTCLRRLEATDPAIVELREWSRLRRGPDAGTRSLGEPDAAAALALLPAVP